MNHGFIKAAVCAPKVTVGDCSANADEIIYYMKKLSEEGAELIVFPELCITGASCGDLFFQESLLEWAEAALERIVKESAALRACAVVGLPLRKEGKILNAAAVLAGGKLLGFVPKENPGTRDEHADSRYFAKADPEEISAAFGTVCGSRQVFSCTSDNRFSFGVSFGSDERGCAPKSRMLAESGALISVVLDADARLVGKSARLERFIENESLQSRSAVLYAQAGMGESTTDYVFAGECMIAEDGSLLAASEPFANGFAITDIDLAALRAKRRMSAFADRAKEGTVVPFDLPLKEKALTRKIPASPFIPEDRNALGERCAEILNIQTTALATRMQRAYCTHPVVGISGGLDSTTALLVTARAVKLLGLPSENIIAVTMPCFGTTDRTYTNACKLSRTLGATLLEVDIKKSVLSHFEDIGQDLDKHDTTYENAQARERTQVLMDIANMNGGFVVGTGDLSELCLGWATYNGDHMSMYGVNADVPKTLMQELVRFEAENCGNEEEKSVLLDVLDTPISPELLPANAGQIAQKTEDLVGPYRLHDFYIYYALRYGFSPENIFFRAKNAFAGEYSDAELMKWLENFYRRFFSSQFKRSCLADGPKIGSVGVSPRGGLMMPSDASRNLWLSECAALKTELGL